MRQTRHGVHPQHPASPSGVEGSADSARPFAETVDLSEPVFFSDTFAIRCSRTARKTTELRIGEAQGYFFVRVKSEGMMLELSSGLLHEGVRCETWHGVASGVSVKGSLLLQCALKCDGETFKLDLRVQGGEGGSETLIYGSSRFQGATLGSGAEVGWHDLSGDETFKRPARRTRANGAKDHGNGTPNGANGHGRRDDHGKGVRRNGSSVRFCPSDQWYEYEVPAPIRVAGE